MCDSDLIDIGMTDANDRRQLLSAVSKLPSCSITTRQYVLLSAKSAIQTHFSLNPTALLCSTVAPICILRERVCIVPLVVIGICNYHSQLLMISCVGLLPGVK